jgi:hypothetical protein
MPSKNESSKKSSIQFEMVGNKFAAEFHFTSDISTFVLNCDLMLQRCAGLICREMMPVRPLYNMRHVLPVKPYLYPRFSMRIYALILNTS